MCGSIPIDQHIETQDMETQDMETKVPTLKQARKLKRAAQKRHRQLQAKLQTMKETAKLEWASDKLQEQIAKGVYTDYNGEVYER